MKSILASISQPKEIQNLNLKELTQLAAECRQRIIEVTSQRGGHLSSSLGTVEITVALLKKVVLKNSFPEMKAAMIILVQGMLPPQFHLRSEWLSDVIFSKKNTT
jgi:transketolase N-terminal domain/subunit